MGLKDKLGKALSKLKRSKPVLEEERGEEVKSVSLSDEAWDTLFDLYQDLGPRPAASASSKRAALRIKQEFEKAVPDVKLSSVSLVPDIWLWLSVTAVAVSVLMTLLSAFGLPYAAIAAGAGLVIAVLTVLSGGKDFLRRVFPSSEGTNVHAVLDPVGEVKRTVIFSAHHDSAPVEMKETTEELLLRNYYIPAASVMLSAVYSLLCLVVELVRGCMVMPGLPSPLDAVMILVSLSFIVPLTLIFRNRRRAPFTGGAGDNLSGVSVVIELLRYFRSVMLNGTRLVFVSFDGEECGAQGSQAWYSKNRTILVNPVNINFDGLYQEDGLIFLSADGNGLVPLSETLASKCSRLSDAMGWQIPVGRLGLLGGMTDAVSAAVAGIDATTLTSMAPGVKTVSHTEGDVPLSVSKEALARAIAVAVKYVQAVDGVKMRNEAGARRNPSILETDRKYKLSKF